MTWRFEPGEELHAGFSRVAADELAKTRAELTSATDKRDAAIHQARRSFKRLRAMTRLARPSLGRSFRIENARWRDAGRLLSAARDATVLAQTFDAVVARCGDDLPAHDIAALREAIGANQPSQADGGGGRSHVDEVIGIIDQAAAQIGSLHWPQTRKHVSRALRDSQDRLRRSWKAAAKAGGSEALHEWRKRVKDFVAHLGLFKAGLSPELKAHRRAARDVAELLGEEHDLCILANKLAAVSATSDSAVSRDRLLGVLTERRNELRHKAFALGDAFSARRGKPFAAAVMDNWERLVSSPAAPPGREPAAVDRADAPPGS